MKILKELDDAKLVIVDLEVNLGKEVQKRGAVKKILKNGPKIKKLSSSNITPLTAAPKSIQD